MISCRLTIYNYSERAKVYINFLSSVLGSISTELQYKMQKAFDIWDWLPTVYSLQSHVGVIQKRIIIAVVWEINIERIPVRGLITVAMILLAEIGLLSSPGMMFVVVSCPVVPFRQVFIGFNYVAPLSCMTLTYRMFYLLSAPPLSCICPY